MTDASVDNNASRFFKKADAIQVEKPDEGWRIELDGRVVKTPMGKVFLVPSGSLAKEVVREWNAQDDKIIPSTMPVTALANAAIDRIAPDFPFFINQLTDYARSDLLCYLADGPADLVRCQQEAWQPILDWSAESFGARFVTTTGIVHVLQPQEALNAVSGIVSEMSAFHLAGLADLAGAMSSVLLALAVWQGRLSPKDAYSAAFIDEIFQESQWGTDRDALQRRKKILDDVCATAAYLRLLDLP